jgi:hypothetical protein
MTCKQTETAKIIVTGTTIELPEVYCRIEFAGRANGITLEIASSNYDTSNCMMFVNPRDRRSIMNYIATRGTQFPSLGEQVASNGFSGKFATVDLVTSTSVTASYALVVVPKICATWVEAVPFQTTTIEDPYVGLKIRAVQEGVLQLTDPKAVCIIANTRGNDT